MALDERMQNKWSFIYDRFDRLSSDFTTGLQFDLDSDNFLAVYVFQSSVWKDYF